MADQKKPEGKFYSEFLSPSELFAARCRGHKIPVRGQKDFFPDDSDEQQQRLKESLDEHWSLISEERVERLGNLVKAAWIPSDQVVELQSPAGKFWQTMGFSANGKQYLLPEEALYLMECGTVQVFFHNLPLSIQDGYEKFLSSSTVSLQQYQVYGHLKRLGYVVHRFDPSLKSSSYARQLNLPESYDRKGGNLKRKRSASPKPTCSLNKAEETSLAEKTEDVSESAPAFQDFVGESKEAKCQGRNWWMIDGQMDHQAPHLTVSGSRRWDDFILFPDLGSKNLPSCGLASPDPSLLPGGLKVGVCDISHWKQRINLQKGNMSQKEKQREKNMHRQRDVRRETEIRQCKNWAEYRGLMLKRHGQHSRRPYHLWNKEVTPLHDSTKPCPSSELQEKISIIKSTHLLESADRLQASDEWKICFIVYQPDTVAEFKKTSPGKPHCHMCVCSFDGPVPDLQVIKMLAFQSGNIPVVFAVVDHGDISFYSFKDFQLPTDVFP